MSIRTVLVNLHIDRPIEPNLRASIELAARSSARVVAVCAADAPVPTLSPDGFEYGEIYRAKLMELEANFQRMGREIDKFSGPEPIEFRSAICTPARFLSEQARLADLVITNAPYGASMDPSGRCVDIGSLILQVGRPVLVVREDQEHIRLSNALIAWKDTREARRAVKDALPILFHAQTITVLSIGQNAEEEMQSSIGDVVGFLGAHGLKASSHIITGKGEADWVVSYAKEKATDLIVSGAYGHSRLREWVFGGVTRTLLENDGFNRFMAN